jgi:NAD-dependent dihydropyrimidine dehydrogenase PreA subunit
MSGFKTLWGLLFRLFPCPTPVGLRRVGSPGPDSPVLVTCNFHNTVRRLTRALRGVDVWLVVAQSRGVNVWCAAGAKEFDTASVVSAVKTSGLDELVNHRTLILPPLAAPGVRASDVEDATGWTTKWGPVRASDLPGYLDAGCVRDEPMKRATFAWGERLDAALGSLFPFYLAGAIGFAIFGRNLLVDYLVVGAVTFVVFMTVVMWIPTRHGWTKALLVDLLLGGVLAATELLLDSPAPRPRADLIIAMVMVAVYGSELGGLASTLASEFDPFAARLGIRKIGNTAFAGTVRTDLLNGRRTLTHVPDRCTACSHCHEVCPLGIWSEGDGGKAVLGDVASCTACVACLNQCKDGAIRAERQA